MPRIQSDDDRRTAEALAEREEFMNEDKWERSKTGSLARSWEGQVVRVFKKYGQYHWVINSDNDGPCFSQSAYETEEDAQSALAYELQVGLI